MGISLYHRSVHIQFLCEAVYKYESISKVGIQFVQVGNSREAREYLQEMDDQLSREYKIRVSLAFLPQKIILISNLPQDMVDTTPYICDLSGDILIKILLGGINRRVDRREAL